MSAITIPGLASVLAGLLPGDGPWPCAADLDLQPVIERLADTSPSQRAALDRLADINLPDRTDPDALRSTLEQLAADDPAMFGALMLLAYGAYYAHPHVLAVVEARCGYAARPPLPTGHPILLPGPDRTPATAGGPPTWREDGTSAAARIRAQQEQDPTRVWTMEEIWSWPMS